MGNSVVSIGIQPEQDVFYSGDTVKGTVLLDVKEPVEAKTLILQIKGKEKTCVRYRREENTYYDNRKETIFDTQFELANFDGELDSGQHSYPFSVNLPDGLPSSIDIDYNGGYAKIQYKLKCELRVNQTFKKKIKHSAVLKVISSPRSADEITSLRSSPTIHEVSFCCCISKGSITIDAESPKNILCPNGEVAVDVSLQNNSSVAIKQVKAELVEFVSFKGYDHSESRTLEQGSDIVFGSDMPGAISSTLDSNVDLENLSPYTNAEKKTFSFFVNPNINHSYEGTLIQIKHCLKVETQDDGFCNSDAEVRLPVYIAPKIIDTDEDEDEDENEPETETDTQTQTVPLEIPEDWSPVEEEPVSFTYDPFEPVNNSDSDVSVDDLCTSMSKAFSGYSVLERYSKDEAYIPLLQNLSPDEYSRIVHSINFAPDRLKAATYLAPMMDDKFCCAHVSSALGSGYFSTFDKVNFVKKTAHYCNDLGENSQLISEKLDYFESKECEKFLVPSS